MRTCHFPNVKAGTHVLAESAFEPLPADALEPTAEELATLVNDFYMTMADTSGGDLGSMVCAVARVNLMNSSVV